ncbi:chromosome condensation regulator [Plasmodium falciparum IGH-CR14]|uniref:Regulator of chromosome condensation, putative n=4 Tax=Plasmodium falciparum TaxID=5833 RepID=C0H4M6_PLAF7|nr:regulator of chromosome condensation, putative [Plasmodium falciparum 3D7]EUR74115.1 hypothetical protein PFBG_01716 [Plasmodium falciparum 7G8]KAF4326832.1 regulator of chromosome condensation [Plasmodium falciparum NF54]KNG73894.1 chromosome condensation regulator [Plasmodium falciparum IGH-CR14]PKC42071.1 regulator of chromosome condensation [Plasmodium falciparum NF54]CAX64046.2 regulator of chromosome condensation, putative [Plasmodium falciparum 3D7]|eukprot:XP_002808773.2 regulator of chromosome condensation, putative [Plasmodium falciparum 3D7]
MKKLKNTLFIFGSGECGQLPPEYCTDYVQVNPTAIPNLPNDIDEVICGSMHTIIKTTDDKLYSFGCNDMGVLGRKTYSSGIKDLEHSPTLINFTFPSKIKKITCGDNHTAILLENGKVYITGGFRDYCGVLGLPSFGEKNELLTKSFEFIEIQFSYNNNNNNNNSNNNNGGILKSQDSYENHTYDKSNNSIDLKDEDIKIINIISGEDHLICLDESHEYIFTMGNSDSCQVCNNFYEQEDSEEQRIKYVYPNCYHYTYFGFENKFENIYCGGNNTYVQLENSLDVYGIGRNAYGSCGVSSKDNIIKKFEKIQELSQKKINQLCGGQSFTVCLLNNNDLYIWGNREILGMEYDDDAYSPLELDFFKKNNYTVKNITCGTDHCLVLTDNGKLFGWGTGGNEFDENTSLAVIEKNEPSEIDFFKFVKKMILKCNKNDSELLHQNLIQIVSFAGGSSHCAFISSHIDTDRVSVKRGYDEIYDEDMLSKKHKRDNNNNYNDIQNENRDLEQIDAHDEIVKKYLEEKKNQIQNEDDKMDKTYKVNKNKGKDHTYIKDTYYDKSTNKYSTKDMSQPLDKINEQSEGSNLPSEQNKRRRSVKTKSYLSNESPTRKQPRRSCKEHTSLNENANKKFYQIIDKPIIKKKRKTTTSMKNKNTNLKEAQSPSGKRKVKSVGSRRESLSAPISKKDNLKRE